METEKAKETRAVEPTVERVFMSADTLARRWKFVLEEACVAKDSTNVLVRGVSVGLIVGMVLIMAAFSR